MHIHPSSPNSTFFIESEESAAVKIQAGFRGYRVRKQFYQQSRPTQINDYYSRNHNAQNRLQNMDSTKKNALSSNMPQDRPNSGVSTEEIENQCATKIQAGVRGFLARKKQKVATDAATKIQAGFRGFKARKEAQKLKQK